jgi:uncharacterized protein (TIGR02996 family)
MSFDAQTRERLFRGVLAEPEEDAPRLVFADWLDDHGEPERAEFIRLQMERARLREYDPRRPLLLSREQELLDLHARAWRADLPGWHREEQCWFRHGFVALVSITAARFARGRSRLLDRQAPLEGVRLRNLEGRSAEVSANPRLTHLRELAPLATDEARVLLTSPHLAGLRRLDFSLGARVRFDLGALVTGPFTGLSALNLQHRPVAEEGLRKLLAAPFVPSLEELNLLWTGVDEAGCQALSQVPLPCLRELRLGDNSLQNAGLVALASATGAAWPQLELLELIGFQPGPEDVRRLAASSRSGQLRSLRLTGYRVAGTGPVAVGLSGLVELRLACNGGTGTLSRLPAPLPSAGEDGPRPATLQLSGLTFNKETMRELGRPDLLAGLCHLDLSGSRIDEPALRALLTAGPAPRLETLNLAGCRLGATAGEALARSGWLSRLAFLNADDCALGDSGIAALAAAPGSASLRELSLAGNGIGPAGARALAGSPLLAELRSLDLRNNPLGDDGVAALASSPHLSRLQRLNLCGCAVGSEGALSLARSTHLVNLAELDLLHHDLPDQAARVFIESPHLARLHTLTWYSSLLRRGTGEALYERFDINRVLHIG